MLTQKTLTLAVPEQIEMLARLNGHSVEELLNMFMANLGQSIHSSGSDERDMAREYYLRTGLAGVNHERILDMLVAFTRITYKWGAMADSSGGAVLTLRDILDPKNEEAFRQHLRKKQDAYDVYEAEQLTSIARDFGLTTTTPA